MDSGIIATIEKRIEQERLDLIAAALVAEYDMWDAVGKFLRGETLDDRK